jgi:hypothetical protein
MPGGVGGARASLAPTRFGGRRRGDHRLKSRYRRLAADPASPGWSPRRSLARESGSCAALDGADAHHDRAKATGAEMVRDLQTKDDGIRDDSAPAYRPE